MSRYCYLVTVSPSSPIPLVLIGCFHEAQIDASASRYEGARISFRQALESIIDQHGIRLIGEEIEASKPSIARGIAERRNLRYLNIDIPEDCRKWVKHRPPRLFNEVTQRFDDLLLSDEYAKAWNLVREYHMYESALEGLRESPEPSLLIVGKLHVEPLAAMGFPTWFRVTKLSFDG
jgi:hypothetical protein